MGILKNVDSWSRKKVNNAKLAAIIGYFLLLYGGIFLDICLNYHLFDGKTSRVQTLLIVIMVVIGCCGANYVFKKLGDWNPGDPNKEYIKTLLMATSKIAIPIIICVAINALDKNFQLARQTIIQCMAIYIAAILVDLLLVKPLEIEANLFDQAQLRLEIDKKVDKIKNS